MQDLYDKEIASWELEERVYEQTVPIADHKCAITSIKMIIQELYDSDGDINHELLRENFACLCEEFGLEDYSLRRDIKLSRRHPLFWTAYGLSKSLQGAI